MAVLAIAIALLPSGQSPRIALPPGPAADALARAAAVKTAAALRTVSTRAWEEPATWLRWAELLSAEARAESPTPVRRAELALLALAQHRYDDAWVRFAECASVPELVSELAPRFLPGGSPAALEDGAHADGTAFAPALPPRAGETSTMHGGPLRGRVERRSMRIEGLKVGAAVLAMRVAVELEGVEIEIEHLSGGPARLAVAIPEHPGFGFSDEYVDWYRQERRGVAHELTIQPGDEAHTLYARFEILAPAWPTRLPDSVPAQITAGTLWLESDAAGAERELLEAVALSLRSGPLRLAAKIRPPLSMDPGSAGERDQAGVSIDLTRAEERSRKLAWIAGAVEARALARPR